MRNKGVGATIPVDISKLSQGLATTFRGVTEVFESIGAEQAPGFGVTVPTADTSGGGSVEGTTETSGANSSKAGKKARDSVGKTTAEAAESGPSEETSAQAENETEPKVDEVEKPADNAQKAEAKESASESKAEPATEPETEHKAKGSDIKIDDIIRVAAQKVKANKANTDKIGSLVKTYGIANLKELPEDRFEDFLTDLSQIGA